ncbi:hypothetical protein B0H21DRAFT_399406 [Amylocystis lapponica]|nr:hypothetical protein B0H21DRAFT_399406 [Amylocystis lapponica]
MQCVTYHSSLKLMVRGQQPSRSLFGAIGPSKRSQPRISCLSEILEPAQAVLDLKLLHSASVPVATASGESESTMHRGRSVIGRHDGQMESGSWCIARQSRGATDLHWARTVRKCHTACMFSWKKCRSSECARRNFEGRSESEHRFEHWYTCHKIDLQVQFAAIRNLQHDGQRGCAYLAICVEVNGCCYGCCPIEKGHTELWRTN